MNAIEAIKKRKLQANLIILDKKPLKTIEAYDNISGIIINGNLIKREQLSTN